MARFAMLIIFFAMGVAIAFTLGVTATLFNHVTLLGGSILVLGLASLTPAGHEVWVDIIDDENLAITVRIVLGVGLISGFCMGVF